MSRQEVLEQVRTVCGVPENERERFIEDFMRSTVSMRAVAGIADRYLRTNRIGRTYFNDLRQVIFIQTWLYLRDLAESPNELEEIKNFWGMVYRRSSNAVQNFLVNEVNQFGGISAQVRTHQDYERFVASHRAGGVMVNEEELIDQFNRGRRSRSEQMTLEKARNGLPNVSSLDDTGSDDTGSPAVPARHLSTMDALADDSFLLHPHEGQEAVRLIIAKLQETAKDAETAQYADIWLGGFYRDYGEVLPVTRIAEIMGITRHRARTLQGRVRNEAQRILKEHLGVTSA